MVADLADEAAVEGLAGAADDVAVVEDGGDLGVGVPLSNLIPIRATDHTDLAHQGRATRGGGSAPMAESFQNNSHCTSGVR